MRGVVGFVAVGIVLAATAVALALPPAVSQPGGPLQALRAEVEALRAEVEELRSHVDSDLQPARLIDSEDRVIGPMIDPKTVVARVGGRSALLSTINGRLASINDLFFETTDCQGQAYGEE